MKEEIKKDKDALQMRLPIMETKMDANMIADMVTNSKNLSREMYAIMERARELEKAIKEQYSRELLSNTKHDDIRECESTTLSLEDELPSLAMDKDKGISEYDKMPLVFEGEFQVPSLVEKNELAMVEEPSMKEMQVEKKHSKLLVENVLIEVEDFNFAINSLTFSMEYN